MMNINPNVFPKGGFVFKDSDGTPIVGNSWEGVIARVAKYRARAGLAPGDPRAEVIAQACATNPVLCVHDNGEYGRKIVSASLKTRILKWLRDALAYKEAGHMEFIEEEERKRRAAICAACPKNGALPTGCQSCNQALDEIRKKIIGGRFFDARLQGCEVTGEYLPVSTHIVVHAVDLPEAPGNCWRKRTL